MPRLTRLTRPHGPRSWAAAVLLAISIALNAVVLVSAAHEVDQIRGDFCGWAVTHSRAALELPPSPPHKAAAQSDAELVQQLGC